MNFSTSSQWGPTSTPTPIKYIIIATCIISLLSAAAQTVFDQFGWTPGPQQLLSLSQWGIKNLYLWQFISFLFIQPYTATGITLSFLISSSFMLYAIWILASSLYDLIGKGAFLRLYFICSIAAATLTLLVTTLFGYNITIAGAAPPLLTLLVAWGMAHPDAELFLFFLIPLQARWLISGIIGAMALIALSQWDISSLLLYVFAILVAYVYCCIAWGWHTPFPETHKVDKFLARLGLKIRGYLSRFKLFKQDGSTSTSHKIVDIETGEKPSTDEAFVDQMLAKISKYGESSLSWSEKRRMQQISEQKRKDHHKR